jgi:3-phenylpropionate/trans-cinnamate dioxygenase ferredoxin subunit
MSTNIKWFKIADSIDLIEWQTNNMCIVSINGKTTSLGKHNNQIFAFAYKCPHAGGIMADGFIDASGNVVCPLHRYKFNMENGRNVTGEGYYLKTFKVEERVDGVYIGIEEKGIFSFL